MQKLDVKEFFGKLYSIKSKKYIGQVFCIIELNKNLPVKANMYFKDNIFLFTQNVDLFHIEIITKSALIIIDFSKVQIIDRTGEFEGTIIYGNPSKIIIIKEDKYRKMKEYSKNKLEVSVGINNIEHLQHSLKSYEIDILSNLNDINNRKTVDDKYKYSINEYLEGLTYKPQIETIRDEESKLNESTFYFNHILSFNLYTHYPHINLISYVEEKFKPIYFIFNVLSRYDFDFRHIYIRRCYRNKQYSYEIFHNEANLKQGDSNIAVTKVRYLELVKDILKRYNEMNSKEKHLFHVIFNRLMEIKQTSDITIEIALFHLIFINLVKQHTKNHINFANRVKVEAILKSLELDNKNIENVIKINTIRNKHFKNISSHLEFKVEIFDVYNEFVNNSFFKLFSKFLNIEKQNEETLKRILWDVYNIRIIN